MKMNRIAAIVVVGLLVLSAGIFNTQGTEGAKTPSEEKEAERLLMQYPAELVTARTFIARGEYGEAIQFYELAIEKHPNTIYVPIAYAEIGNCYKIQGNDAKTNEYYKKAIPLFEELIAASDSGQLAYDQANKGLAGIYIQLKDSGRAIGHLNRLVEFESKSVFEMVELGTYWMSLADAYEKQEKWEDAVSAYRQALERFTKAGRPLPNISRTHAKLTACYRKLHDWKAAIKELQIQIDIGEKYLKDHPNVSESRQKLIAHGIQTAHMEIKGMRKMQGSYVLPVTVGVGIVIAIGILSLLLMKQACRRIH